MKLSEIKNRHAGETAWIIGRGLSLNDLALSDIGSGFVIAINQSITPVENLGLPNFVYSMYSYGCELYPKELKKFPHNCINEIALPKKAPILVDDNEGEGKNCLLDYPQRIGYLPEVDMGINRILASGATSIFIAKYLGASSVKMLCFDAYTDMDFRAIDENGKVQKTDAAYIAQRKQIDWAISNCGIPVDFIKPEKNTDYETNDNGVLIGTPIFDGKTFYNYTLSLAYTIAGFMKANIPIDVCTVMNSCQIDDARNWIFSTFLESPYKKLFFIDADMGWDFRAFLEMYLSPEDFVGAAYPFRNRWNEYTATIETPIQEKDGLIKAHSISTGFLCLSKKACKEIVKAYPNYYRSRNKDTARAVYNVFGIIYGDGIRYSEDMSFCKRYRDMGGEMWLYPHATLTHAGGKTYTGCIQNVLNGDCDFNRVFDNYGSDKGYAFHHYGAFYKEKLGDKINKKTRLLEIGLNCNGTNQIPSLKSWKDIFTDVEITGFDIRDFSKLKCDGVSIVQGDQGNAEDVRKLKDYGPFDVIVDDGSHLSKDQIISFETLYPMLSNGGKYFIEDIMYPRNKAFIDYLEENGYDFDKRKARIMNIICVEKP